MSARRAVLLSLLFAVSSFAFTGRPLSDLRYDQRALETTVVAAASDGTDFLLLYSQADGAIRGQIVRGGMPTGAPFYIADGAFGSMVWTGSVYLVAFTAPQGVYVATIPRGGGLLAPPRLVIQGGYVTTNIVTNGKRVLVAAGTLLLSEAAGLRGVLLDLDGNTLSGTLTLAHGNAFSFGQYDVAGVGDGFAATSFGWFETRVFRYDANGVAVNPDGTLLEPPYAGTTNAYYSLSAEIGGAGDNAVVVFSTGGGGNTPDVKSAIVGPQGQILKPATTIYVPTAQRIEIPTMGWNGSAFDVILAITRDASGIDEESSVLRVDANGARVGDIVAIGTSPAPRRATAAAVNGTETLVAWRDRRLPEILGSYYAILPRGASSTKPAVAVGMTPNTHERIALSTMGDVTLAAWTEADVYGWVVRASRVDRNGNYLDGPGILLGQLRTYSVTYYEYDLAVDNDGTNWMVVWTDSTVHGARVDATGRLLDTTPITIAYGSELSLRWSGTTYLVVSGSGDLDLTPVSRDGVAGPTSVIVPFTYGDGTASKPTIQWRHPALLCDAQRCMVAVFRHAGYALPPAPPSFPTFVDEVSLAAFPLDRAGNTAGDVFTIANNVTDAPLGAATNGNIDLLVYQQPSGTYAALLAAGAPTASAYVLLPDNGQNGFAATWDGQAFALASRDQTGITTSRVTTSGTLSGRLRLAFDNMPHWLALAPSASGPALLGYVVSDARLQRRTRAFAAFVNELGSGSIPAPPSRPRATRLSAERLLVRWDTVTPRPFGYSLEVRVANGGYRQLAIAPGNATEAVVPLQGIDASAVRLRAWSAGGWSVESADAAIGTGVTRVIRK